MTKYSTSEFLNRTSLDFAIYIAMQRGIPRVNDGLKNVQRVALWLLRSQSGKVKTVALGGKMAEEKLYVHGDVSATDAISNLAAPYKNNAMLIKGHGQFGSRVAPDDGIGAPRYTEVSRSKVADAILYPDSDILPMMENYDGSNVSPEFFVPILPLVLLNGVSGVVVGWSTSILPRSLTGLIEATQDALAGKKTLRGLTPHFERYNIDVKEIGKNQYEFSGQAEITDTSTITVTELPPGLTVEKFRKRLIEMEEREEIATFHDRSSDKINIVIRMKRGSLKGWTADAALELLKLREKRTERIVVINWEGNAIMTYAEPDQLVRDFVQWRLGWYRKRFEELIRKASVELSYWEVLRILFEKGFAKKLGTFKDRGSMRDEIVAIVSKAKGPEMGEVLLDRVLSLPTYRWTKEFADEVPSKIAEINAELVEYRDILSKKGRLEQVYAKELEDLRKAKLD